MRVVELNLHHPPTHSFDLKEMSMPKGVYIRGPRRSDIPPRQPKPPAERFWPKVDKNGPVPIKRPDLGPCWLWTKGCTPAGYGAFSIGHKHMAAHRFAYEVLIGPIRNGLDLDHLCRVRSCVNPSHLEPVTRSINLLRGDTIVAKRA